MFLKYYLKVLGRLNKSRQSQDRTAYSEFSILQGFAENTPWSALFGSAKFQYKTKLSYWIKGAEDNVWASVAAEKPRGGKESQKGKGKLPIKLCPSFWLTPP